MPVPTDVLAPVLVLVCWTLVMWCWMYATRFPAMRRAGMDVSSPHPRPDWSLLPDQTRAAADNYNHLHEQPTIFYALMAFIALTGGADDVTTTLAWAYVGLRIVHSFVQVLTGFIPLRFGIFALATFCLFGLAGHEVYRVWL